MQVDDQRLTRKDAVFDNVKILNGNRIPLTNTLADKLPLRGSLIALKSGNIHDLYYADGLQWVPVTDGGSTANPPLDEVLMAGNSTGGNDIEITNGDRIVSETDGRILIESFGPASSIFLNSAGQVQLFAFEAEPDAIRLFSVNGGVTVDSDTVFNLVAGEQIFLQANTTDADAVRIFARSGGIDIDANGGIDIQSVMNTVDAVRINAPAGGIDIDAGNGGITVDSVSGITINSGSGASFNLTSAQAAADAVRINAPAGGIDIDAGTGGIAVNTTGAMVLGSTGTTTLSNPLTRIGSSAAQIVTQQTEGVGLTNSPTVTGSLTDAAGTVTIGDITSSCTLTFSTPYPSIPSVVIAPRNANAVSAGLFISAVTTGNFTVVRSTAATGSAVFSYIVMGYE